KYAVIVDDIEWTEVVPNNVPPIRVAAARFLDPVFDSARPLVAMVFKEAPEDGQRQVHDGDEVDQANNGEELERGSEEEKGLGKGGNLSQVLFYVKISRARNVH